mmetsp:Transcript_39403/g.80712  ORF Transcript_39403/g.80712 Transcript_39403/m.80712 type:complete len:228 (+) Transcript_39403:140-823(+)
MHQAGGGALLPNMPACVHFGVITRFPLATTERSLSMLLSSSSKSASKPRAIEPLPLSLRKRAGLRVKHGRMRSSGQSSWKYIFHRNCSSALVFAAAYRTSLPSSSYVGSDPYESDETSTWSRGTSSAKYFLSANCALSVRHVRSTYPPALHHLAPSSISSSVLSMCVGRNVWIGMSVSFTHFHSGASKPFPGPMWQYMTPALPLSIPPTLHSAAVSAMILVSGCEPR